MSPPVEHATTADVLDIPAKDEPSEARLLTHTYDGIREYDNPLPGWWSAIFWASIVFSAIYLVYYHVGHWGPTPTEKYASALADMVAQPRAATVMGLLEEARLARIRGFKVAQQNGSMKTAFGRFKDFIVWNFCTPP